MSESNWITITDPNEGAFTVQMPKGWQNQAYLIRPHDQVRSVVTSRHPDGGAFLFMGDPNLPSFLEPSSVPGGMPMMYSNPLTQVRPHVTADAFFPGYVRERYGRMPGFRVTASGPSPRVERLANDNARKRGMNAWVTTVQIAFEYTGDNGVTTHALLHGTTLSFGTVWVPDASGILTRDDPARYDDMLLWMASSYKTNPHWRQSQDNIHAQRMAQGAANHQSAMAAMQSGHQARMNAIHQAGEANTRMFDERQAQMDVSHQSFMNTIHQPTSPAYTGDGGQGDASHQRFVNYINDQETVVGQTGEEYQVETGHERYYVNKHDNTYVGTDSTVGREDLRSHFGLNSDAYEETKIKP